MSRFRNTKTDVVVSVDDSKDARFVNGWEPVKSTPSARPESAWAPVIKKATAKRAVRKPATKTVAKKAAASKSE